MGHVVLNTGPVTGVEIPVTGSAADTVRMKFNVSGMRDVDVLKSLAAAFISECERIREENPAGGREASVAITQAQTASMFAVAAATAGL